MVNMKTLVAYVFHEYNSRVQTFFHNCIFKDPDIDFLIICNSKTVHFPVYDYVKIVRRDNIGYDFGGWSEGILTDDYYKKYDQFIFANSSIIGPYLPSYYKGKWTDVYLQGLSDTIKLFGSTINTVNLPTVYPHVQSYIFSMNRETLDFLIAKGIFSLEHYVSKFEDAILHKEVRMSRLIVDNGWNIGCLHQYYKDVDFTFRTKPVEHYKQIFQPINNDGDFMFPDHLNRSWTLYELVFIKGNRFE